MNAMNTWQFTVDDNSVKVNRFEWFWHYCSCDETVHVNMVCILCCRSLVLCRAHFCL